MQVPKVDDILWRQLKREVRAVDFQLQKASANYSQALIPVIKTMKFMKKNEHEKASECITDTFKTLCLHIKGNIAGRRERIKKELEPKFRPLCQQEALATNLFGDNFQEAVKKLEGVKSNPTSSAKTFLGKKGGNRQSYQHNNYNNNRNNQPRFASQYNRFDKKPYHNKKKEQPSNKEMRKVGSSFSYPYKLQHTPEIFSAGKTRYFKDNWSKITSDKCILQTISGYEVELDNRPKQILVPTYM